MPWFCSRNDNLFSVLQNCYKPGQEEDWMKIYAVPGGACTRIEEWHPIPCKVPEFPHDKCNPGNPSPTRKGTGDAETPYELSPITSQLTKNGLMHCTTVKVKNCISDMGSAGRCCNMRLAKFEFLAANTGCRGAIRTMTVNGEARGVTYDVNTYPAGTQQAGQEALVFKVSNLGPNKEKFRTVADADGVKICFTLQPTSNCDSLAKLAGDPDEDGKANQLAYAFFNGDTNGDSNDCCGISTTTFAPAASRAARSGNRRLS